MYPPLDVPLSGSQPFTDYSKWRLLVNDGGRHTWHYMNTEEEAESWPQNSVDKFWLGMPVVCRHTLESVEVLRTMILESARITTGQGSSFCGSKWVFFLQTPPIS